MSAPATTRYAVDPGWTESVYCAGLDESVRALFWPDGRIGIEHHCKEITPGEQLICAPKLQLAPGAHEVVSRSPLTIERSISCPDCGLHGFIRNSRWVSA